MRNNGPAATTACPAPPSTLPLNMPVWGLPGRSVHTRSFGDDKHAYDRHTRTRAAMSSTPPTLGFVLHDVARLLRKRFEQRVRSLGFTRSQWQVLVHLAQHEGINQAGLADILEIEPITLLRILERLEAAGPRQPPRPPVHQRVPPLFP